MCKSVQSFCSLRRLLAMIVEVEMLLDEVLQVVAKYILPLPSGVAELSLPLTFSTTDFLYH